MLYAKAAVVSDASWRFVIYEKGTEDSGPTVAFTPAVDIGKDLENLDLILGILVEFVSEICMLAHHDLTPCESVDEASQWTD